MKPSPASPQRHATPRPDARPHHGARLLTRALAILDRFAERDEWTFMELCRDVGLHKSTAFRIVSTLEAAGYLEKRPATGRYAPGRSLLRLERVLLRAEPLRWVALPPLQDLVTRTGETAHIGVLYQGEVVTVQVVEGTHTVRMHGAIGKRSPAHCSALGKALLAQLTDDELDQFIERHGLAGKTARTTTDIAQLRAQLADGRRRGFAVDDEELEPGLRCLGVPITDETGRAFAALSISGPASRLTAARDAACAALLTDTARTIAAMLAPFRRPPPVSPAGRPPAASPTPSPEHGGTQR